MLSASIPGLPVPVSRIVFGTASLRGWPSSAPGRARLFDHLDFVLAQGGNAFDTARVYGLGESERILGEWMKRSGCRDKVIVITKGGHPSLLTFRSRIRADALESDLGRSLRALQTGSIDLYLLHRDDPTVPVAAIVDALYRMRDRGLITAYGVSNWDHRRIEEANVYARAQGVAELSVSSPHFSLAEWRRPPFPGCVSLAGDAGREARAWYERTRTPVLSWSSLAAGYFRAASSVNDDGPGAYRLPVNEQRRNRARQMAQQKGLTLAQVALAFVIAQPFPVFPVISTRSASHYRACVAALDVRLSPAELVELERGA